MRHRRAHAYRTRESGVAAGKHQARRSHRRASGQSAMKNSIYMDNHSTTRVDPRVLEAMLPHFSEEYGNAASRSHAWGWRADEHVERARGEVARLIGAEAREIVFTSGAT